MHDVTFRLFWKVLLRIDILSLSVGPRCTPRGTGRFLHPLHCLTCHRIYNKRKVVCTNNTETKTCDNVSNKGFNAALWNWSYWPISALMAPTSVSHEFQTNVPVPTRALNRWVRTHSPSVSVSVDLEIGQCKYALSMETLSTNYCQQSPLRYENFLCLVVSYIIIKGGGQ